MKLKLVDGQVCVVPENDRDLSRLVKLVSEDKRSFFESLPIKDLDTEEKVYHLRKTYKKPCQYCGKKFKSRGMKTHLFRKHIGFNWTGPMNGHKHIAVDKPVEESIV